MLDCRGGSQGSFFRFQRSHRRIGASIGPARSLPRLFLLPVFSDLARMVAVLICYDHSPLSHGARFMARIWFPILSLLLVSFLAGADDNKKGKDNKDKAPETRSVAEIVKQLKD